MMLVHNHPGGDPTPSSQDMELTRRISQVATDVGIRVLDHLVVAESRYFSFQEQGLL
jgi:DNA repair protein RadC